MTRTWYWSEVVFFGHVLCSFLNCELAIVRENLIHIKAVGWRCSWHYPKSLWSGVLYSQVVDVPRARNRVLLKTVKMTNECGNWCCGRVLLSSFPFCCIICWDSCAVAAAISYSEQSCALLCRSLFKQQQCIIRLWLRKWFFLCWKHTEQN